MSQEEVTQVLEEATEDIERQEETVAHSGVRIAELEIALQDVQTRLLAREEEVNALKERLALGAAKYRSRLLASAPEVPEELVTGESVEEIDASFATAREIVQKVKGRLEAGLEQQRVPAGAPPRSAPDLSTLSPQEKIAYGLARR